MVLGPNFLKEHKWQTEWYIAGVSSMECSLQKKEAHLMIKLQHCAFQCHIFVLPCISRTILFCSVYFDSMSCSIYSCCWFSVVLLCVVFFIVYHEEGGKLFVLSLICIYATQRFPAIGGTKSATNKQCLVD